MKKVYEVLILDLYVEDNAPEWASMLVYYDKTIKRDEEEFGVLTLTTEFDPVKQKEDFLEDLKNEVSERIDYDVEQDIEVIDIDIEFEVLG